MRYIGPEEVARLSPARCIEAMREAFMLGSAGQVRQPPRQIADLGEGAGIAWMPGALEGRHWVGAKAMTRFPAADGRGHDKAGVFLVFDRRTRALAAIVDAPSLTLVRTAAATVAATAALARPNAGRVGIAGCGALARAHVRAFAAWPGTASIAVWGRDPQRARDLVNAMQGEVDVPLQAAEALQELVPRSDVICTVTAAVQPFLPGAWLRAGQHVNAVGSSTLHEQEIEVEAVARCDVFVDSRAMATVSASELRAAAQAGRLASIDTLPEIGEVLAGRRPGRHREADITLFKSLGLFAQDALAAELLLDTAPR